MGRAREIFNVEGMRIVTPAAHLDRLDAEFLASRQQEGWFGLKKVLLGGGKDGKKAGRGGALDARSQDEGEDGASAADKELLDKEGKERATLELVAQAHAVLLPRSMQDGAIPTEMESVFSYN